MRIVLIAVIAAVFYLQPVTVRAEAAAAAAKPCCPSAAAPAAGSTSIAPSVADQLAGRPDAWRYQWHDNRWWYYTTQNTWLYYDANGWQHSNQPAVAYSAPRSYRSYSADKHVDASHSLNTVGNYPRYWLWQRLGN